MGKAEQAEEEEAESFPGEGRLFWPLHTRDSSGFFISVAARFPRLATAGSVTRVAKPARDLFDRSVREGGALDTRDHLLQGRRGRSTSLRPRWPHF
eukprot:7905130-Pyramimonas_sp.AAC.1